MAAKKIAGVDRKVFIVAAIGVVLVGLYLRSRANASASTSAAAPSGSTLDSGLGSGGAGAAAATPSSNGLGSDAVGTQGLLDQYAGAFGQLLQANIGLAENAGTYINSSVNGSYNTTTTYNVSGSSGGGGAPSAPVTTPSGVSYLNNAAGSGAQGFASDTRLLAAEGAGRPHTVTGGF